MCWCLFRDDRSRFVASGTALKIVIKMGSKSQSRPEEGIDLNVSVHLAPPPPVLYQILSPGRYAMRVPGRPSQARRSSQRVCMCGGWGCGVGDGGGHAGNINNSARYCQGDGMGCEGVRAIEITHLTKYRANEPNTSPRHLFSQRRTAIYKYRAHKNA